jgi:hypothetical protein
MTGQQVRIWVSVSLLISGAIAANSGQLESSVGLAMIIIGGALALAEYVRSYRQGD